MYCFACDYKFQYSVFPPLNFRNSTQFSLFVVLRVECICNDGSICKCSVRSLVTSTKTIRAHSDSRSSSHFIHSSCFTFAVHSSCKSSTTAQMRRRIIGRCLCESALFNVTVMSRHCFLSFTHCSPFVSSQLFYGHRQFIDNRSVSTSLLVKRLRSVLAHCSRV